MQTIINTRTDLDAIIGTAAHVQFMAMLRGTLWRLSKDDDLKTWVATQDNTTVERFGLTRADFAPVTPPVLPLYVDVTPTYKELRAAAYPPIPDQLDTIFHGGIEGWMAEIQAVKDAYPKEPT